MAYDPNRLTRELDDLRGWISTLDPTSRPPATGDGVHGAPGSAMPGSSAILAARIDAHAVLGGWVKVGIEDGICAPQWPADGVLAMIGWMRMRVDLWTGHPADADMADEIHGLWRTWRRLAGEQPARRPRCTGCGAKVVGVNTDGVDASPGDPVSTWRWAHCTQCGMVYTFDAHLKTLGAMQEATAHQWAIEFKVKPKTLQKRIERARLRPDRQDQSGRKLYERATIEHLTAMTTTPTRCHDNSSSQR